MFMEINVWSSAPGYPILFFLATVEEEYKVEYKKEY